jgi:long-chain acyl-CoA synthetase
MSDQKTHETVVHMLKAAADHSPSHLALIADGGRLTYREYARCVGGFAADLQNVGARGARVALICGNSVEMAIATFAVHASGAQAVPVNPSYTAREAGDILADADPVAVIHDADAQKLVDSLASDRPEWTAIRVGPGGTDLLRWRDDEGAELPDPLPSGGDLGTLQYTGGTTGRSKGVNLSHAALAINLHQCEALVPSRMDAERMLCVLPLFHVYASHCCLHTMAIARGTLVIQARYHPQETLDAIAREGITIFPGTPTIFSGLLNYPGFAEADLSSLAFCYSGSAPLPEEVLNQWEAATGTPIIEGYGQSEAGPVLTYNPLHGLRKAGSVGVELPDTELQIVDAENGNTVLAAGEIGEIRARGPQIMQGYRNLPVETSETLRDGWLYTGDLGEFDQDGYLYIRDRKKDMIITSGYNVYPREVDDVLYTYPDVLEAAVVGTPDSYRGEVGIGYVSLRQGAECSVESLLEHCKINLTKYKIPALLLVLEEMPKTTVGKVDKKELRVRAVEDWQGAKPAR